MSIKTEIARLTAAKQKLANWLTSHNVRVSINTNLTELVDLLDSVSTESPAPMPVQVKVTVSTSALLIKTILPTGAVASSTATSTNATYLCPQNSMLVLYGTCNGGTTALQAYPSVSVIGGLTSESVYFTASNSSATRPMGVFVIRVGSTGGTVTFTRTTSKDAIM